MKRTVSFTLMICMILGMTACQKAKEVPEASVKDRLLAGASPLGGASSSTLRTG